MFDSLESVLTLILDKLDKQEQLLQVALDSLTTRKAVAKFLTVHPKTIRNYIDDGRFQEGREYIYDDNGDIEFLPLAIVDFKKNHKLRKNTKAIVKRTLHPSAAKFLGDRLHG